MPKTSASIPLDTVDEKGKTPKKSRLRDAAAAKELFTILHDADKTASGNRAEIDGMFDGVPPYTDAALKESGQGFRTNLNFDEAADLLEKAMSAYVDIQSSVDVVVDVKTNHGEPELRRTWEEVIAEEFSRMLRAWPDYQFNFLSNANNFIKHGVSVVYFENDYDWKWKVSKLGDFLIPHQTPATESKVEVAMAVCPTMPHTLYGMVKDKEEAKRQGWNLNEVYQAIMDADGSNTSGQNWEEYEEQYKNNDLCTGARASNIDLVHIWVKEFDGTVSHFITLKDGENEDFLFKRFNRFASIPQAFTFFTYGIGTNGFYHGIRGLGYKIFPHIQTSNRVQSAAVDVAVLSSSVLFQPVNEEALDDVSLSYYGPFALMSPGLEVVNNATPNISQNLMPILNSMKQMIQTKSGQYSADNVFQRGLERSKFEVEAELNHIAKLNITSLNLFYEPWEKLLREMMRRVSDRDYPLDLEGGKEVREMRERIEARGVPLEALFDQDLSLLKAVRAVGSGSAAERQVTSQRIFELSQSYDSVGRDAAVRDLTVSLVGHQTADRYTPKPNTAERIPLDAKFAGLENIALVNGEEVPAYANDTHMMHINSHLSELEDIDEAIEAGEADLTEQVPAMVAIHGHATKHLEFIESDPTLEQQANAVRQILQQKGETIHNGIKAIQAQQRKEMDAGGDAEAAQGIDEAELRLQRHQEALRMKEEEHLQAMRLKDEKAAQELALTDAKNAVALRNELIKA